MVYVRSDGTVSQNPPIHQMILRFILGIVSFVVFFFKSLLGMDTSSSRSNYGNRGSGGGNGGSGGGGGGGGGGPFRPGKPNIRSMGDINRPTVNGAPGGCPGGGCGM